MKSNDAFLSAIEELEIDLFKIGFKRESFETKGVAYFLSYRRSETIVRFLYGPADWDVEVIVNCGDRKFALKDILGFSEINIWFHENRYVQKGERNIRSELFWYLELIKFGLPTLEGKM